MAMQDLTRTIPARRQLKISYWSKSLNFSTVQYNVEVCKIDRAQPFHMGRRISWHSMVINATQDWTKYEFVASSWDGEVGLFVGLQPDGAPTPQQQPTTGSIWFADIQVEDTAMHNVVRRAGAPLRIYDPVSLVQYKEGRDFDTIAPVANFTGFSSGPQSTSNITAPKGSRLQPGQRVLADYYAVDLVFGGDTYACMMHHDMFQYMERTMQSVLGQYDKYAGMFIHYDEIRTMHGCELCSGPFDTAGELLAWHAANATWTIKNAAGKSGKRFTNPVMTWDDMFNPFHNAGDSYFLINGTLNGSWLGLDPSVTVVNWGAGDPDTGRQGLEFFSQRGHEQIFAGYYDSHDGVASATSEVRIASTGGEGGRIKGVDAWMYTTWRNNYTEMCRYAETIRNLTAAGP